MARTPQEIYDSLAYEKSQQPELVTLLPDLDTSQTLLADLTTSSRVAVWRLMLWVVAVCQWVHEKLWDKAKDELQAIAASSHIGTLPWYVQKAKEFQYGFPLVIQDNVPVYATDEPSARIIARAAGKEESGYVLLKLAKLSSGSVVPLSGPELAAFDDYIDHVKMAGMIVNLISDNPDLLKVNVTVYYDPLVIAPDGTLILAPGTKPVEDAIRNYVANLPFNGALVLTDLVDAMQAATGVTNPVLGDVYAKWGFLTYQLVDVQYIAHAGHAIIDPLNDLNTTITYVPHVV